MKKKDEVKNSPDVEKQPTVVEDDQAKQVPSQDEASYEGVAPEVSPTEEPDTSNEKNAVTLNQKSHANDHSDEEKAKLEKDLSKGNVVARVITWTGDYLKVKFMKDNKPFSTYKGKSGSIEDAKLARDEAMGRDEQVNS